MQILLCFTVVRRRQHIMRMRRPLKDAWFIFYINVHSVYIIIIIIILNTSNSYFIIEAKRRHLIPPIRHILFLLRLLYQSNLTTSHLTTEFDAKV